jgi:tetratricopeptide (TPR) repeat protein
MQPTSRGGIQRREIRVFISSTFVDMHEERDELAKFVFPRLRKLCEQRGAMWSSVDLRWGIPEEEASEGRVLALCLDEIQRCRPYFIGILGERYGWIPDSIVPGLIESEPWLADMGQHSITELEILHGVLNNPEMADHAFFYFRDPSYLDTLPDEQRRKYRDEPGSIAAQKLMALKGRIRSSGFPVEENYPDPRALGSCVERDLSALIEKLFPEGTAPGPLDRERLQHEAFAASRARVYVPQPAYFDRLDTHVLGEGPPLAVLGESGSGKSALLANWALRYRQRHPDGFLLIHFIGSTTASVEWEAMLRRIMGELQQRFAIRGEIPKEPAQLRLEFANWLGMAAVHDRIILLLDALDQLEDRSGALDLVWLPSQVPPNVRIVVSTLPGRPLEAIRGRGWPTMVVEALAPGDRKRLVSEYLAQYRKKLGTEQVERIVSAPQTANPLFLRTLLEELRLFGEHERLWEQIAAYLQAKTIEALFAKVLARYEQDYDRDRPQLVRDTFSLIWAARRGLSESELLDMLGSDGSPLPSVFWSPLHLAAEQSLIIRSGLIGFFHAYFRRAVESRYVPKPKDQQAVHLRLAAYFDSRDLCTRMVDELPWQLMQAQSWDWLYRRLRDPGFLKLAWEVDAPDAKSYWAQLEVHSRFRLVEAYRGLIDSPRGHEDAIQVVSGLLYEMGYLQEALVLQEHRIQLARERNDLAELAVGLQRTAMILGLRGDLNAAMKLHRTLEQLYRDAGDMEALADVLNSQAVILKTQGDLEGALALLNEQERLSRGGGERHAVAMSLHNQGTIRFDQGGLEEAWELFRESEHIYRELGDKAQLVHPLGGRAAILLRRGNLPAALDQLQEVERVQRMLGDRPGLTVTLGNQAVICQRMGQLDKALALQKEVEELSRELGLKKSLASCLNNQAVIVKRKGDLPGALELFRQAEGVARELGAKLLVQATISNQASILHQQGKLDQALPLRQEEVEICRQAGYREDLAKALYTQSELLFDLERYDGALRVAKEAYDLAKALGLEDMAKDLETRWFPP